MQHNLERRQLELEEESRLNGGKRETDRVIKHAEKKSIKPLIKPSIKIKI